MDRKLGQQMVAEFLGTFALIFIGAGSVVILSAVAGNSAIIGIALAHGLVLAIMISALGGYSGGHFNPAVTLGVWVAGKIDAARAGVYILVQLAAGVTGAGLLALVLPSRIWKPSHLGVPAIDPGLVRAGFGAGRGVLLEAILTFFLVLAVFGVALDDRGTYRAIAGLGIGLVLTFDILMGGVLTGAAMNPARWFGPAIVSGHWTNWWVWILGPLAGGVIAAVLYQGVFLRETSPPLDGSEDELPEPGDFEIDIEAVSGEDEPDEDERSGAS